MVDHQLSQELKQTAQQALTARLLQPLIKRRRPQRLLLLKHALTAGVVVDLGACSEMVSLSSDPYAKDAPIHTRLSALPFEDDAFDLVVLQHLINDGCEAVL